MDEILNPTLFLGNFEFREPVTSLTDFFVAIIAFVGFLKFYTFKGTKSESFIYFKIYFLCFAIGLTSAAWLGHGLQAYVGPEFKRVGWVCAATGFLFFGLASLVEIKKLVGKAYYSILRFLFFGQYLVLVFLMLNPSTSSFIMAQLSTTISLIVFIFPIHIYNYLKTNTKGSLIIIFIVIYSILPGITYNKQISINRWFNYHDISHVLMAIFMASMIIGTSKLAMLKNSTNEI